MQKVMRYFGSCISVCMMFVITLGVTPELAEGPGSGVVSAAPVRPYVHYRMPAVEMIEGRLVRAGRIAADASAEEIAQAVEDWGYQFAKVSPSWARPDSYKAALENEQALLAGDWPADVQAATPITAVVLVVPVEFDAVETFTIRRPNADYSACITSTETFTGPMHGAIPYPGGNPMDTIDNQTAYYPSTEPEDLAKLIFGVAGITDLMRPGDPQVEGGAGLDISGLTVQTYYDAQSDGSVVVTGTVAPWSVVTHTEAYYGIDACIPGQEPPNTADGHPGLGRPADLVIDAAEALKAQGGDYATYDFWKQYDDDGDGMVDTLWIVHAGRGQEAGGGSEGEDSIWSHSSSLEYYGYADGYTIHDNGTLTTTDDIRIGPFTFQPEDGDLGVYTEEFGHNYFDFPDLYTLDSSNSVGWWSHMAAGSWGGKLGGVRPVNMPLWFRMTADCGGSPCGWADPVAVLPYSTTPVTVVIGQAGEPAGGTVSSGDYDGETIYEGIRIDLPDQVEEVPNRAGTGHGAYSGSGAMLENTLDGEIDLTSETAPLTLTVGAYWDIEEDWDYGYVAVSTNGVDFANLDDLDGVLRETNPNGNNRGHGLTGQGSGTLRFDLSAYAGMSVTLRFWYSTDPAVNNPGWWIDDVMLDSFSEDFEGGMGGWTSAGWVEVPYTANYPHYYLVEWRNSNGFDESLKHAYNTNYSDQDEWRVDRVRANVPGAVVMYRNTKYDFTYELYPQENDAPSIGSKYGLLVVDTNFFPVQRPSGDYFSGRLQSLDATLALEDQMDFTLETWSDVTRTLLYTETITGASGIADFDDAFGYYPGFFYPGPDPQYLYYWDSDASVVIPSVDGQIYSTRVTGPDKSRPHFLDGMDMGSGHYLGSGNPGDENVQYGVHIELVDKAGAGGWGAIKIWNAAVDYTLEVSAVQVYSGDMLTYTVGIANRGAIASDQIYTLTLPSEVSLQSGDLTWSGTVGSGVTETHEIVVEVLPAAVGQELVATADFDDGTDIWMRSVTSYGWTKYALPVVMREFVP